MADNITAGQWSTLVAGQKIRAWRVRGRFMEIQLENHVIIEIVADTHSMNLPLAHGLELGVSIKESDWDFEENA